MLIDARITIIQRNHHRFIPNLDSSLMGAVKVCMMTIMSMVSFWKTMCLVHGSSRAFVLQRAFPHLMVQMASPDHMTMMEQINLVRNSSVFVAVEGGALDNLIFAFPGTVVVDIGRDRGLPFPVGCLSDRLDEQGETYVCENLAPLDGPSDVAHVLLCRHHEWQWIPSPIGPT